MTIAPMKIGIASPGSISGCFSHVFGSVYTDGFDKKIIFLIVYVGGWNSYVKSKNYYSTFQFHQHHNETLL